MSLAPRNPFLSLLKVVGIDLAGSPKRNTGICVLLNNRVTSCSTIHSDEEIISYIETAKPDLIAIDAIERENPSLALPLHPRLPYTGAQIVFGARHEMARSVEDVLARRTRALLLDARAAIEIAPRAASLIAAELGRDAAWAAEQVAAFRALARGYLLDA